MNLRRTIDATKAWITASCKHLLSLGLTHWLIAGALVITGVVIGEMISENKILIGPRFWIYKNLQRISAHSPSYFDRTVVVQIGDEEFWKGDLARRSPLKRTYLSELLKKINSANPAAIAVDIDLSSQTADGSFIEHPDYREEDATLLRTINAICLERPVVLPRRLVSKKNESSFLGHEHLEYGPLPALFDYYSFDSKAQANLRVGFVSLPYDIRQVPLYLKMKDGSSVESFAAATARTVSNPAVEHARAENLNGLPYGTFLAPWGTTLIGAGDLSRTETDALKRLIEHKIVLVGGAWHEKAYREGPQVDTHLTPVGEISGVLVQANYIEALLSRWTSRPLSKPLGVTVDVALAAVIALIFAWNMRPWVKLVWATALSFVLILITYVFWQNLGLFFDFSIPLFLLGSHTFVEKVRDWRHKSKAYDRLIKGEISCAPL
ncbi:MAG TPA: CHASE2 domain-containing protein [Pyrinomonadaceae bacterium]|nr:CHASE2 domain-containing protein [Pyrinomonadaceae bacterium]